MGWVRLPRYPPAALLRRPAPIYPRRPKRREGVVVWAFFAERFILSRARERCQKCLESALKMGHLSDKTEEKQAGAGESVRYLPLLRPVCPLISAAVGLYAWPRDEVSLIHSITRAADVVSLAYPVANAAASAPPAPCGRCPRSDRGHRRGVVGTAHGLTEGTGGGG